MRMAHIVPPDWEGLFKPGGYKMALAHWVLDHQTYAGVVKKQSLQFPNTYVLLDNGLFENEQRTASQLQKAIEKVGADEIILPDAFGDAKVTLEQSWEALHRLRIKRVMFVPQGSSLDQMCECLKAWLGRFDRTHKAWELSIGISSMRRKSGSRELVRRSRIELMKRYREINPTVALHLLGIPNVEDFATLELPVARECRVRGVDSSLALALGANGVHLTPSAKKIHLGTRLQEQYEAINSYNRRLIRVNQAILSSWVSGEDPEWIDTRILRTIASRYLKYYAEGFCSIDKVLKALGMPKGKYLLYYKLGGREGGIRYVAEEDVALRGDDSVIIEVK